MVGPFRTPPVPENAPMNADPKTLTPNSVGRFVASIRSVATASDGLVVCRDCRRHMSDFATSCPHCGAEAVATGEFPSVDATPATVRTATSDVGTMSLMVIGLAVAAYIISKVAGL